MAFILRFLLFVSVTVGTEIGSCDRDTGPAGSPECVFLPPYYSKHQWATCLTNTYIQTYSKGEHICRDISATYCWYQCMIEIHNLERSPVYNDCACGPDAPTRTGGTTQPTVVTPAIPDWCFSPSGAECSWYRACLEKRYPCKESGSSYALDYAEKFCILYQQHYSEFDYKGQQWIDGVRKCLQVSLVPILRPFVEKTCEQIKQMAFGSHRGCYLNPDGGKTSICDIGVRNWARVFWTIKSAVTQAPSETLRQMIDVMQACGGELLTNGIQLIQLKIELAKNVIQERIDELSEYVSNTLSKKMGWVRKGVLHFGYPSRDIRKLKKRSINNATEENKVYINILLAESSQFDLNNKNSSVVNISAAAIDAAKAIERGDVRLDMGEGIKFTELSVCANYNCTETSLQVTPAPPKDDEGINVTTVVIGVCAGTFSLIFIVLSIIVLRKMCKS